MRNLSTLILFLIFQATYAQWGLEYTFEISQILIDEKNVMTLKDDFTIEIYTVSKEGFINDGMPRPIHYNNLIRRNDKLEKRIGLVIPDFYSIEWGKFDYIVIEMSLLEVGKKRTEIMFILISLDKFKQVNFFKISSIEFQKGYFKINEFSREDFNEDGILDVKDQLVKMTRSEIKNFFKMKKDWKNH